MTKSKAIHFLKGLNSLATDKPFLKTLTWVLKVLITLSALGYIVYRLKEESADTWEVLLHPQPWQLLGVAGAVLLLPLNLGLEAAKWRRMVGPFYPGLSMKGAFKAILAGISAGIFTPNGIGAYAGRVFLLPSGRRTEAAMLTFLDRICLMYITLWAGTVALEYLLAGFSVEISHIIPGSLLQAVRWGAWSFIGLGLLLAAWPQGVARLTRRWAEKKHVLERLAGALEVLDQKRLLQVLLLSLARYLTFSLQYYLLLQAFGYQGDPLLAFILIWIVFFIKSVIPTVSLTELGIRESVAIAVMGAFAVPALTAMSATFLLYLINLILPAVIGLVFVQKLKL